MKAYLFYEGITLKEKIILFLNNFFLNIMYQKYNFVLYA